MAPSTAYYGYQFRAVAACSSEGYITLPSTAGAANGNRFLGILQNKPKYTGAPAEVMVLGVSKVRCGANSSNIGLGEYVVFKNDGLAYASSNFTQGDVKTGPVLTTNAGTTSIITVVIRPITNYTT